MFPQWNTRTAAWKMYEQIHWHSSPTSPSLFCIKKLTLPTNFLIWQENSLLNRKRFNDSNISYTSFKFIWKNSTFKFKALKVKATHGWVFLKACFNNTGYELRWNRSATCKTLEPFNNGRKMLFSYYCKPLQFEQHISEETWKKRCIFNRQSKVKKRWKNIWLHFYFLICLWMKVFVGFLVARSLININIKTNEITKHLVI